MNPREEELAKVLVDLGMARAEARVLVFLAREPGVEVSSTALREGTHLRQPEVSVAAGELRKRGWVDVRADSGGRRGRPVNHYRLVVPLVEVAAEVECDKRNEISWLQSRLERLRALSGL